MMLSHHGLGSAYDIPLSDVVAQGMKRKAVVLLSQGAHRKRFQDGTVAA